MRYQLLIVEKAEKFLNKVDKSDKIRISNKLEDLENNPRLGKPLTANLSGLWSLRIGKFRAVYQILNNKLVVLVLDIEHRKKSYR